MITEYKTPFKKVDKLVVSECGVLIACCLDVERATMVRDALNQIDQDSQPPYTNKQNQKAEEEAYRNYPK